MSFIKKLSLSGMNLPWAIIVGSLIIGLSIFFTTWIFFGGDNNRQKLFTPNPATTNRPAQQTLTPQQIQQLQLQQQQQREALLNQNRPATSTPVTRPATTTPLKKTTK